MASRKKMKRRGLLTDWQDPDDVDPEPGDKIDFRRGPLYNHVGIADGHGNVFHFAGDGGKKKKNVIHRHEPISDVAKGSKVRINNSEDKKLNPKTRSEILQRAQERQGTGAGTYNARTNNCEHNATDIRYGEPVSLQSSWWKRAAINIGRSVFGGNIITDTILDIVDNSISVQDLGAGHLNPTARAPGGVQGQCPSERQAVARILGQSFQQRPSGDPALARIWGQGVQTQHVQPWHLGGSQVPWSQVSQFQDTSGWGPGGQRTQEVLDFVKLMGK